MTEVNSSKGETLRRQTEWEGIGNIGGGNTVNKLAHFGPLIWEDLFGHGDNTTGGG